MDPLGSGDHFASAWRAAGIVVRLDARGTWWVDGAEEEEYLDRLHLELRTRSAPAETPEARFVMGTGGSDVTVEEWARRLRSDPAFGALLAVPVDVVLFDQGPI
jgi:hypothetical protein